VNSEFEIHKNEKMVEKMGEKKSGELVRLTGICYHEALAFWKARMAAKTECARKRKSIEQGVFSGVFLSSGEAQ